MDSCRAACRYFCTISLLLWSFVFSATITVTNTNDSGAGSLRQAIVDAAPGDMIDFSVAGTITLTTGGLTIGKNLSITGPGAAQLTVDGNNVSRIFYVNSSGVTVNISDITIDNGNSANWGGGIENEGTLNLTGCIIADCSANGSGNGYGGGVDNYNGTVTITHCHISGNSATNRGGGVCSYGGTINIIESTITGNTSDYGGGGIDLENTTASIKNSILALNTGGGANNFFNSGGGALSSGGYNLSNDAVAAFIATGDQQNATANLAALTDNGGPTQTHALLAGSNAIDHIPEGGNGYNGAPATDQRGYARSGANRDVGAFEFGGVPPIPDLIVSDITSTINCSNDNVSSTDFDVTVTNQGGGDAGTFTVRISFDCGPPETNRAVASLAAGASTVINLSFSGSWNVCNVCDCQVIATADVGNTVTELDENNNQRTEDFSSTIPELSVVAIDNTPACAGDGNLTGISVTVTNTGCGDANNVAVRLTSDCGLLFTDQVTNLTAGETKDVLFPFTAGIVSCTCNFTATVDPDDTICECTSSNNSMSSTGFLRIPDLEVQSETLAVTCSGNGNVEISGTVTVLNNGCGPALTVNIPMRFTLYDNTGCTGNVLHQWTETLTGVNISSAGGTQVFSLTPQTISENLCANSTGCNVSILIEADYSTTICEWDGTDNSYCADKTVNIPDLVVDSITAFFNPAGEGFVDIRIRNVGCAPVTNSMLRLTCDCGSCSIDMQPFDINPGSAVFVRVPLSGITPPCVFTAVFDPENNFCECDETNNSKTTNDRDGDGITDGIDGQGDRDNDSIENQLDYDPSGYIYDEVTGNIVPGGLVTINGLPGTFDVLADGSNGYYRFVIDGPAQVFTLSVTPPPGYVFSTVCPPQSGDLDPTGLPSPYMLGSGENGTSGQLVDWICANNPYYLSIQFEPGE